MRKTQASARTARQTMASHGLPHGALVTWKEISEYAGRSVRTLQRWEHEFGFPVHRPYAKDKSAVLSSRQEIDEWFRTQPLTSYSRKPPQKPDFSVKQLTQNARQIEGEAKRLRDSAIHMHEQLRKALDTASQRRKAPKSFD